MLWFWFIVGLIFVISGVFMMASLNNHIHIGKYVFDSDELGGGFIVIGSILAILMIIGLGVHWLVNV